MKTYIWNKKKEAYTVDEVYCNRCGQKCDHGANRDYASFSTYWGYFSNNKDTEKHSIDLCERCYDWLVKDFVISPLREEYSLGDGTIVEELPNSEE